MNFKSNKYLVMAIVGVLLCVVISISAQTSKPRLIPIVKGWAKNQINAVIFRKNSLTTFQNTQFAAFYDEDQKVVIAKRKLGSEKWEIRRTQFSGNTTDAHNSISIAVDGKGFLHLAWGMHNAPLNYSRSLKPKSLEFSGKISMTEKNESRVTYPEFYNLPNGDLLFFYRDGASGNGNLVLNRYDVKKGKWSHVQDNLIDGEGKRNAYTQIAIDEKSAIHISWVWRETPNVASNHDLAYTKSSDGGKTWKKSSGEKYELPIRLATAETIWKIPQNSELINQTSMTTNELGNPFIATYWRAKNSQIPQYRLIYFDGRKWNASQIGTRKTAFSLSGAGTKKIPVSRPQILVDKNKIYVIFRDAERASRVSVAFTENVKKGFWKIKDLTENDLDMWEPTLDSNLWRDKKILNLFLQKVGQGDGEKLEEIEAQMISVLEWKPF